MCERYARAQKHAREQREPLSEEKHSERFAQAQIDSRSEFNVCDRRKERRDPPWKTTGSRAIVKLVRTPCARVRQRNQLSWRVVPRRNRDTGVRIDDGQKFAAHLSLDHEVLIIDGDNSVVFFEDRHKYSPYSD